MIFVNVPLNSSHLEFKNGISSGPLNALIELISYGRKILFLRNRTTLSIMTAIDKSEHSSKGIMMSPPPTNHCNVNTSCQT